MARRKTRLLMGLFHYFCLISRLPVLSSILNTFNIFPSYDSFHRVKKCGANMMLNESEKKKKKKKSVEVLTAGAERKLYSDVPQAY